MRISDWSSDVCSSDLAAQTGLQQRRSTFETPSLERLYYWLEWRAELRRQYRPSSRGDGPLRGRQDRRALRGHPKSPWIRTRYDAALIAKVKEIGKVWVPEAANADECQEDGVKCHVAQANSQREKAAPTYKRKS